MADDLTEEEKRKRRSGGEIDMTLDELAAHRAKTRPQWREVEGACEMTVDGKVMASVGPIANGGTSERQWHSLIVTNDVPDYGWHHIDFQTLDEAKFHIEQWWHHARRGEAYRPEDGPTQATMANENNPERVAVLDAGEGREGAAVSPPDRAAGAEPQAEVMSREAIERDPWNAVALDVPADASKELLYQAATTAQDCRFALDDRAELAESPEQAALWAGLAERATARQKEVEGLILQPSEALSMEAMRYDPWASIYLGIPAAADTELLREAFDAATYCASAVEGAQEAARHLYEPSLLGVGESREANFARASARLDELDALIASRDLADSKQLTADDIAERVQQLVDDPELLSDEIDQRVLDALDARRVSEVVQPERSAEEVERLYEPTEREPERSELPAAAPALAEAMPAEMTDDAQIQYDRWTGERIGGPEDGLSHGAGHTLGGGMGCSR
jgi:hypothetical protein